MSEETNQEKYQLDHNKWLNTLGNKIMNKGLDQEKYQLDHNKWLNTLPNHETTREVGKIKKYSLTIIFFVMGLILVSVIKNDTRNLQKEISNLMTSIEVLKHDLYQETLEHDVITSPENISRLAKKYLETNFIYYEKSQIKHLDLKSKIKQENVLKKKNKKEITETVKIKISKNIEQKKAQLKNLQRIYSNPAKLPGEIKLQVAKKISKTKKELKELYSEPVDTVQLGGRVSKWFGMQIVKAFFGMPIIPGK